MAQSNLTVTIGADSTKMRADLALAEASVKSLRREVNQLAKDAQATGGDTTQLQATTAELLKAEQAAARLSQQNRALRKSHEEAVPSLKEVGRGLREVGTAFGEMADRTIPHFREVLALSLAVAGAEFVKFTAEAARAADELQDKAEAIGISMEKLQSVQLGAAQLGADPEAVSQGFERFVRTLGTAQLASDELGRKLKGAELRKAVEQTSDAFTKLGLSSSNFARTAEGNFQAYEEVAKRIDALGDDATKAAIAAEFFGKGWSKQIEVIKNFRANTEAANKTLKEYDLVIGEVTVKQSAAWLKSFNTLSQIYSATKIITGNILGTAFVPLFDGITKLLGENQGKLRAWAQSVSKEAAPVMRDLVTLLREGTGGKFETQGIMDFASALEGLGAAARVAAFGFRGLSAALTPFAAAINAVFGTHFTGAGLVATAIILRLSGAFRFLWATISVGVTAVRWLIALPGTISVVVAATRALMVVFAGIGTALGWPVALAAALLAIIPTIIYFRQEIGEALVAAFNAVWDAARAFGSWLSDTFNSVVGSVAQAFTDAWNAAFGWLKGLIDGAIQWLQGLIDKAKEAAAFVGGMFGGGGTATAAATGAASGPLGAATGGFIRGPGSGTSDSILARLSNGEFVLNAGSVRRLGVGFLHGLNSFAAGGLVGAPPLRFAAGGLVTTMAGGTPVHLHLGSGSFALSGASNVVDALVVEAHRQQMRSAGTKPSWFAARPSGR